MAFFLHHRFLEQRDVGHNRLWIDARKQRIHFLANGHVLNAVLVEDARQHASPRTVHRVDGELKIRLHDQVQIGKLAYRFNVGGF
jgi:hypothetical protein